MTEAPHIRLADPERDGDAAAAIYRPAVEASIATFEEDAPDGAAMAARMRDTLERYPWLVAEADGRVIGYAYAGPHHGRPGYRWSVNISVYLERSWQSRGIGLRLYEALLAILRRQGFVNVYAGVALPNPASVRLHEAIGMSPIGTYRRVGFKHGAWHDVTWYGMRLADTAGQPPEPVPLGELQPPL